MSEHLEDYRDGIAPKVVEYLERLYAEAKKGMDREAMDLLHEAKHCVRESLVLRPRMRRLEDLCAYVAREAREAQHGVWEVPAHCITDLSFVSVGQLPVRPGPSVRQGEAPSGDVP